MMDYINILQTVIIANIDIKYFVSACFESPLMLIHTLSFLYFLLSVTDGYSRSHTHFTF